MKKWITTLAVMILMTAASNARAYMLPPTVLNPVGTVGVPWTLTYVDSTVQAYSFSSGSSSFAGTLTSYAYTEPGGTFTFAYQVKATSGNEVLDRFSITGFTGFTTDAYWLDGTGVGYDKFTRLSPNTVGANFAGGLAAGQTSAWLVVRTNATEYSPNQAFLQDGGQAPSVAFAPAPLPGSCALFGTGALGLVGFLRRKRTAPIEA